MNFSITDFETDLEMKTIALEASRELLAANPTSSVIARYIVKAIIDL